MIDPTVPHESERIGSRSTRVPLPQFPGALPGKAGDVKVAAWLEDGPTTRCGSRPLAIATWTLQPLLEVDHQAQRVARLDGAIDRAVAAAPEHLRAIVSALQALRGVAQERQ